MATKRPKAVNNLAREIAANITSRVNLQDELSGAEEYAQDIMQTRLYQEIDRIVPKLVKEFLEANRESIKNRLLELASDELDKRLVVKNVGISFYID